MKKILLLAAILAVLPYANGFAQSTPVSTTFTISANVLTQLTVVTDVNLNFGNVFQASTQHNSVGGIPTYTAGATPTAAKFTITGAASREVTVAFSNHTSMTGTGGPLPVTYASNDAEIVTGTGAPSGGSGWDPTSASDTQYLDGTNSKATVYLGGQVAPTTAMSGAFTGTGTITVAYTGN